MNEDRYIKFPCAALPQDASVTRLLGVYPQRQDGLWMQRVRVPSGELSPGQWKALADIARRHTPAKPLHLTTRQDIELHGLAAADLPRVQQELADAGLTGLGACGDAVRNVTVCPCSGVLCGGPDLTPLAAEITRTLESLPDAFALPRKFKISLSACEQRCAQPLINDLGFVAVPARESWLFRASAGGSLGLRPALGIELPVQVAPDGVVVLAVAALELFKEHADRTNRRRARLRHVRERFGDEAFVALLMTRFEQVHGRRDWPKVTLKSPAHGLASRRDIGFINGDIWPDAAEALAEISRQPHVRLRITNHHAVAVFAADAATVAAAVGLAGLPRPTRLRIVACPGTRWCSKGLAAAHIMSTRLQGELAGADCDALVAISGCPNGCAQSSVADIGLVGAIQGPPSARSESWTLMSGGGLGRDARLAQPIARGLTSDEAVRLSVEAIRLRIAGGAS